MAIQKIRWGILGTGWISSRFAEDLKLVPDAVLTAVASRRLETAQQFAEQRNIPCAYGSYAELVNNPDIDVVYVATPHIRHKEDCLLCLEAGKAVLCEKPFAMNAQDARVVVELARKKNLFCMEAMWMRFLPMAQRVRELVKSGGIGEIRSLSADFGYPTEFDPKNRFFNPELGGGALLDRGAYPLSLAFYLLGQPIGVTGQAYIGETGVDEQSSMILDYGGGTVALLSSTLQSYASNTATIIGSRGKISIHAPFCRPEKISLLQFSDEPVVVTSRSSDSATGLKQTLKSKLKSVRLLRKLRDMRSSSGKTISQLPLGNGYSYQANEVVQCLISGKVESPYMPLDETIGILDVMDKLRYSWDLVHPHRS